MFRLRPVNDEVLIEVTASGVNYVDIRERLGVYHSSAAHVDSGVTLPRISGLQAVGIVQQAGPQGDSELDRPKGDGTPDPRRRLRTIRDCAVEAGDSATFFRE